MQFQIISFPVTAAHAAVNSDRNQKAGNDNENGSENEIVVFTPDYSDSTQEERQEGEGIHTKN